MLLIITKRDLTIYNDMFILCFYFTKYVCVYKYKYIILYCDISIVGTYTYTDVYMYLFLYIHIFDDLIFFGIIVTSGT